MTGSRAAPLDVRRVAIVCESTSCLPPALVQRYHIGIIPIPFVFDAQTSLDGVDMTPAEFYARLAASHTPPESRQIVEGIATTGIK